MDILKAPLQKIQTEIGLKAGVELSVLREDLSHPFLSGNKWRKLKYNLLDFKNSGKKAILTFGGKFSNHLVACAAAGKILNIPMIGILRGDETVINPQQTFLKQCGMHLLSLSREEYRLRENAEFLSELSERCVREFPELISFPDELFMIPEGGSNAAGVRGCVEIMQDIPIDSTHIMVACGTGSTLAGISIASHEKQNTIGVSVLKGENFLPESVVRQGAPKERTKILFDYHFGGYAKSTETLNLFCKNFSNHYCIPLEPVYTGKLFFACIDLLSNNYFPKGSKIVLIHTGGIFDFKKPLDF